MNIVLLGFFTMLGCILIIPAGASLTAVNVAMKSYLLEDDPKPLKTLWAAFKENFKLSTVVWLIHLVFIAVLIIDFLYYRAGTGTLDILAQTAVFVLIILLAFELLLVFVVIAEKMETNVWKIMGKSLDLAFTCMLESFFILVISIAIPIAAVFLFPAFVIVLPGVIAYLSWQILPNMLQKYKFRKGNAQYQRDRRKEEEQKQIKK